MLVSTIPQKIPVPFAANALSPYIRSIPPTSQTAIQNGAASWPDGFPAWCFQPNGFPFGQDFNGVLNSITSWIRWYNSGGPITYDAAFSTSIGGYESGTILQAAIQGNFWFCTVDNNLTNPDAGGAGWIGFSLSIPTALIHYGVDTGAADAIVANVNPGIQSLQSGMIFEISAAAANLTQTPTANIQGLGAKTIQRWDGSPLQPSDILPTPVKTLLSCDITANKLYLLNPGNLLKSAPVLIAPRVYYVSPSGNDGNNGLTLATAFASLQEAANTIAGINTNGFGISVIVADGTYTGGLILPPINGSGSVAFIGDVNTPANCTIQTTNVSAIIGNQVQNYSFTGFRLSSTGTSSADVLSGIWLDEATVTLGNINFSQCAGGHVTISAGGQVAFNASAVLTISGGCPGSTLIPSGSTAHITALDNAAVTILSSQPPSLTITTGVVMGQFVQAGGGGSIGLFYSSITGASNVTGKKYNAYLNGTINSGGNGTSYFPGSSSGTTSTGGQYS